MRICSSLAAIVLIASGAAGQAKTRTGAVSGTVQDEAGNAIPNVEVTALKTGTTVRSDTAGEFMLAALPAGSVDLSFRRLAFEPILLSIQVPANDTTEVEVTLTIVAQKLNGVIVLADPEHRRILDAFESRRKMGIGHFITRAEIEKRHPMMLSDMMRMIPGTRLMAGENGRVSLRFARASANCPPQFFIDGIQAIGFAIDDMPPGDVEGIEIYSGAAGLPPEYNKLRSTANCGTVVFWTRIPGNEKAKP